MSRELLFQCLSRELEQDAWDQDVTARLLSQPTQRVRAWVRAKQPGIFSGSQVVATLREIAPDVQWGANLNEGQAFEKDTRVVELTGPVARLLSLERTFLNYLGHLCGVATLTRRYVAETAGTPTRILATRKTLPGLRSLELAAVEAGGGYIHRRSLSDGILIKENHQLFDTPQTLLKKARATKSPLHGIEIEVQSLAELDAALEFQPDVVMLDNLGLAEVATALEKIRSHPTAKKCAVEVSGGISPEQVRPLAQLGIDFISVGKITHSAAWLDLSFEFEKP